MMLLVWIFAFGSRFTDKLIVGHAQRKAFAKSLHP